MVLAPGITNSLGFGAKIGPFEGGIDGEIVCLLASF